MPLASTPSPKIHLPQKMHMFFCGSCLKFIAFLMHHSMEAWMIGCGWMCFFYCFSMSPCIMKWHMFIRKIFPWLHCSKVTATGEKRKGASMGPILHPTRKPMFDDPDFWTKYQNPRTCRQPLFLCMRIWNIPAVLFFFCSSLYTGIVQEIWRWIFLLSKGNCLWNFFLRFLLPQLDIHEPLPGEWTDGRRVRWLDEEPWELRWSGYGVAPYLRWGLSLCSSIWIFEYEDWNYVWSCLGIALVNLSRFIDQFRPHSGFLQTGRFTISWSCLSRVAHFVYHLEVSKCNSNVQL